MWEGLWGWALFYVLITANPRSSTLRRNAIRPEEVKIVMLYLLAAMCLRKLGATPQINIDEDSGRSVEWL
jgi:hypothetical protein